MESKIDFLIYDTLFPYLLHELPYLKNNNPTLT